jgi:very-short-patch-repair endonuclease
MKDIMKNHIRELRQTSSDAEKHLWYFLRAKRLNGYKFRRQHLIHPFVVDFVCLEKKLIIELDGGQHAMRQHYDEKRTVFLESKGYKVVRFWNNVVLNETREVLNTILAALNNF